eukprot:1743569-Karenia_brevis.AAC.1
MVSEPREAHHKPYMRLEGLGNSRKWAEPKCTWPCWTGKKRSIGCIMTNYSKVLGDAGSPRK